jgi:hypothetical protein
MMMLSLFIVKILKMFMIYLFYYIQVRLVIIYADVLILHAVIC